jgi:hypothetical protein
MAITTLKSHVERALSFYNQDDIYFAYGRTTPWETDMNGNTEKDAGFLIPIEDVHAEELDEVVGYKKIEEKHLVVPDTIYGTIPYRTTTWKKVPLLIETVLSSPLSTGENVVQTSSTYNIIIGTKLQIGTSFKATVVDIETTTGSLILDTPSPSNFESGTTVLGGARVEGARWVYIKTALAYDEVPIVEYRQLGVYSKLEKQDEVLPGKMALLPNEVKEKGILEVIDNRKPTPRHSDQKELLELILEF